MFKTVRRAALENRDQNLLPVAIGLDCVRRAFQPQRCRSHPDHCKGGITKENSTIDSHFVHLMIGLNQPSLPALKIRRPQGQAGHKNSRFNGLIRTDGPGSGSRHARPFFPLRSASRSPPFMPPSESAGGGGLR